jgi:hypothetical protein
MRRAIMFVIGVAFVLAVGYGCLVVTAVATAVIGAVGQALTEIGSAIATLALILTIPVLVALAWVLFAADWMMWIEVIRRLLELLGLI